MPLFHTSLVTKILVIDDKTEIVPKPRKRCKVAKTKHIKIESKTIFDRA